MDSRIGQLMRQGKIVYYAYANGYSNPATEGSLEDVEIALGLRQAPSCAKAKTPRTLPLAKYRVHVQKKYPAWNEVGGFDVEVEATSKSDANQQVRQQHWRDGMFIAEGPVYYRAQRLESSDAGGERRLH